MKKKKKISGIQKRYLQYTTALLVLALLLSSIGVWMQTRRIMTKSAVDQYVSITEQMGTALQNLYQESDEVTAECILYEDVQQSLRTKGLPEVSRLSLGKYFAYIDLDDVADYCYVDNKKNVYNRSYSRVSYEDVQASGFQDQLGEEYSKTKWFWTKDTLFGTEDQALFIGRYVRSLEYTHKPGMLFFKMGEGFLSSVMDISSDLTEDVIVEIIDTNGQICLLTAQDDDENHIQEHVIKEMTKIKASGMIWSGRKTQGGILSVYRDTSSGLYLCTYVPNKVLNQDLVSILMVLIAIYLFVILIAVLVSIYFSQRFTKPIEVIRTAMTEFDGGHFDHTIHLNTKTELDDIGRSYNKMLKNIEELLKEIKEQEKELRTSELNMLISQINPHFLYNTLDTIYMLARLNKEETTMRMIQALSKYLRLCLSKGEDIVTVGDELENVKSYMEIQQIRNQNLFSYQIDCQVNEKDTYILKLVLQPIVENAVKYGFQNIFEGGEIGISVKQEGRAVYLSVSNNGMLIEEEMADKINGMNRLPVSEFKECFSDKKHGYGLMNILTRLRLKYGSEAKLFCEVKDRRTVFTIEIPEQTI